MGMWESILKLIDWFVPEAAKRERSELGLARNFVFTHLFGPLYAMRDVIPEMRIASVVQHVEVDLYGAYAVADEVVPATATEGLEPVSPESVPEVSGTTALRNLLYAVQWWIFAGFAFYIWWRWCRDTLAGLREADSRAEDPTGEQVASGA